MADLTRKILSSDGKALTNYTHGMKDPSVIQKIKKFPTSFTGLIVTAQTGTLEKPRSLFKNELMEQSGKKVQNGQTAYSRIGTSEDGCGILVSNFPKGTLRDVKRQRVIQLWQQVWSQQPIQLNIPDEQGRLREITAQFDPDYDLTNLRMTDLGKVMSNKNGSSGDRTVTLNLADDLYDIVRESTYDRSAKEEGKQNDTHQGVKEWHYFFNDILYQNTDNAETPYRVRLDVKEREGGGYVYQLYARKAKNNEVSSSPLPGIISPAKQGGETSSEANVPQTDSTVNSNDQYSLPEIQQRDAEYQQDSYGDHEPDAEP